MPPQCLMFSQRIHLCAANHPCESTSNQLCESTSNQPCESSNASSDRCGQEPWASVALWARADVVIPGTFLGHVCPAFGCPGGNSRTREGQVWVCADVLAVSFGLTTVQVCWMLPRSLQLCNGSPAGRWWKPCSYRLAAQWRRSCLQ